MAAASRSRGEPEALRSQQEGNRRPAGPWGTQSAESAREAHHVDLPCAATAQGTGSLVSGRSCRVDVIDEAHRRGRRPNHLEGTTNVSPSLRQCQPALARKVTSASQKRRHGELPEAAELGGQPLGRDVPAFALSLAVTRDKRQHGCRRARYNRGDELRTRRGKIAPRALLPRTHQAAPIPVVGDRGPCAREGEPPAGALRAAPNGPGPRRTASLAQRRRKPH